jgi:hypothetical protein
VYITFVFSTLEALATKNLLRTSYEPVFHARITANARTLLDYKDREQNLERGQAFYKQ